IGFFEFGQGHRGLVLTFVASGSDINGCVNLASSMLFILTVETKGLFLCIV
ncbi:unnamed protein product, partial [Staurois parvus]